MHVTLFLQNLFFIIHVVIGENKLESDLQSIGIDAVQRIGGSPAPDGAYPFLVGLIVTLIAGDAMLCTGSLISATRVVTAGHCWIWIDEKVEKRGRVVEVVLGSNYVYYGGLRIMTDYVVSHPYWAPPSIIISDMAIIYLPDPITFSNTIQPIKLPYDYIGESFEGIRVVNAGFGIQENVTDPKEANNENPIINHVQLTVIHNLECESYFGRDLVNEYSICTSGKGGVGMCFGDSGGPLVAFDGGEPVLVGIASVMGVPCQKGVPSIFTRVTSVLDFIGQHMQTQFN